MDPFNCAIFGEPSDFRDILPTYEDVMRYCLLQRRKIMEENVNMKEPSFKGIVGF